MDIFEIPDGENRKPHQIALDWLLEQDICPGDIIKGINIDRALCLVDPNKLPRGRQPQQKWALARLAEWVRLRDEFEAATGEVIIPAGDGNWLVCQRDEVAETLADEMFSTLFRLLRKTSIRIGRARKDGISPMELERRNRAIDKIAAIRSFTSREIRKSLSEVA